ncbi:hypothetical protein [Gallaecimonas xiamenensis]|uniref:Uncharacterized protein n=1 Tax=Gallaecimonas xiamenensis 3-C-1 TaxID=745411 RepID=K2JLD4_9GAMM|nr:hypothetical protein [Gallaecimonas xiamenensis]EKE75202.1 hypothetical protein B3C1_07996 [Gallaecimonas xiamenensis 3-C-1]
MNPKVLLDLLVAAGKNVVAALITKKMVLWALERYAASTKTKVDDFAVQLVEGGLEADTNKIQAAVQGLTDAWLKEKDTKPNA